MNRLEQPDMELFDRFIDKLVAVQKEEPGRVL